MFKIEDQVSDSGYTTWDVLDANRKYQLICTCDNKEDAELVIEALTTLDEVNAGYYT